MEHPDTDLAYLERFCKGDRARMEKYVMMYLQGAPALYARLTEMLEARDAEGLAVVAHSLRPQVHFMGAQHLLDRLTNLENLARTEGAGACSDLVKEVIGLNGNVMAELKARPGHGA
jgi:HPt (histidine-containing phosphotransfer) domain-containing protein